MPKSLVFKRRRSDAVNPPRKDPFERIVEDWYGEELSQNEKVAYLPQPVAIGAAINGLFGSMLDKTDMRLIDLRDKWGEVVGDDVAKVSQPLKIRNKILMIKVSHSIWKLELENHGRKIILDKVRAFLGEDACRDIRFTVGE